MKRTRNLVQLKKAYIDPLGVSVEMAHRLAKATGITAESWLMMQMQYALWEAKIAKIPNQIHIQRRTPSLS